MQSKFSQSFSEKTFKLILEVPKRNEKGTMDKNLRVDTFDSKSILLIIFFYVIY